MHWLALYLPELPLEAVADAFPATSNDPGARRPIAIVDQGSSIAITADTSKAGAHVGMTAATLTSLVPGLITWPRQPQREAALVQRLALAMARYGASLVLDADGVRLELSATARLFGGMPKLLRSIRATARATGIRRLRMAHAATATAASILARLPEEPRNPASGPTRAKPRFPDPLQENQAKSPLLALTHIKLNPLPISALLPVWTGPTSLLDLLEGIGCQRLADLRSLPRQGLTRRGGQALMNLVARAYGDEPDPQDWYEPPPSFQLGLDLAYRADNAAALVFAAQRLVQPLTGWLARHWLAAARITLELRHETSLRHDRHDRPTSSLEIAMAEPSRDAAQIMVLLRERLQRMTLPAPVYALELRLNDATSHVGRSTALWANPATQQDSERMLIDRLSARLGSDRVRRALLVDDHRPEHAMRWVSAQSLEATPDRRAASATPGPGPAPTPLTAPLTAPTAPRPVWLLANPLPLREVRGRPVHEGRPLTLSSRAERIEAGWFDGALVRRDYHVAHSDHGCWWIFREHASPSPRDDARGSPRWFLHGIFGCGQ